MSPPAQQTLALPDIGLVPIIGTPSAAHGASEAGGAQLDEAFDAALADSIVTLHRRSRGDPASAEALRDAVRQVATAVREGHVCAELNDECLARLPRHSAALSDGGTATPLVLRGPRLYLRRYWHYERLAAARLRALNQAAPLTTPERARQELDTQFPPLPDGAVDWQKLAAATALLRRLCVLSGGPGTGKTTTVVRLLAAVLAVQPNTRIALAAPTGKAAARMQQALLQQIDRLQVSDTVRAALPRTAQTVHRLLGTIPGSTRFRHHAERPLPWDLLVIDEGSMLDLALAAKLLDALPAHGRLVLLGDKDQLASVEAGAVFGEITRNRVFSEAARTELAAASGLPEAALPLSEADGGALPDAVVWLNHSYRFAQGGGIGRVAAAVNQGDATAVLDSLRRGALEWQATLPDPETLATQLLARYSAYIEALERPSPTGDDAAALLEAFERFRVLSATRSGPWGTERLNRAIEASFRRLRGLPVSGDWYPGRPVMITGNDYALRLYNGDIGIACRPDGGTLMVAFQGADGSLRSVAPGRLAQVETAFALTIHKSQGSEFDAVDLILDAPAGRSFTRELIYTGITRARHRACIWASEDCLRQSITQRVTRRSSLLET